MDSNKNDPFDDIMKCVGNNGKFQYIHKYLFVFGLSLCTMMVYINYMLALNIPDHWCFVPGRNETHLTVPEWRNLTVPTQLDSKGEISFSNCLMYNHSFKNLENNAENHLNMAEYTKIGCQNGYEYDTMYYDESIPMKENWVCEKDLYVTKIYMVGRIAEVAGTFSLGHFGDIIGRRMICVICILISLLGRISSILTTHSYILFLITNSIAVFAILALFQSPLIIGVEISRSADRAELKLLQCVGWTLATIIMPFVYWWSRHWFSFMWLTTLPIIILIFFSKYLIESPRWLINKKKFKQACEELKKIAKINKTKFTLTEEKIAAMFNDIKKERTYGYASFFNSFSLAKNTLIISYSSCIVLLSYYTLLLFSSKIGGDPFINFSIQNVSSLPAYFIGKYLANTLGRRITNILLFFFSALIFVAIVFLVLDSNKELYIICLVTTIQFLNGLGLLVIGLQLIEVFPTCLRQTGSSIVFFITSIGGVAAPTLVYIGSTYDMRLPYIILGVLNLLASIGSMFVPETLNCKLPDTLEDAKTFGKDQVFWSFPTNSTKICEKNVTELESLNPEKKLHDINA